MSPTAIIFDGPFSFSPRPNRAHEIPWREWSHEAFAFARESDRPVLLSLTSSWSPDAHAMDESTYSAQAVIDLVTSRFVPVRVDVDERPDVHARYGTTSLPTTSFLTSEGDPIIAYGLLASAEFTAAADSVLASWTTQRDAITQRMEAERATRAAERATAWTARSPGSLTPGILDAALEILESRWSDDPPSLDGDDAGLTGAEIRPNVLRLWRYAYHRRGLAREFNRAVNLARVETTRVQTTGGQDSGAKFARVEGAMLVALAELASSDEEIRDEFSAEIEQTAAFLTDVLGGYTGAIGLGQIAAGLAPRAAHEYADAASGDAAPGDAMPDDGVDRRVVTGAAAIAARGLLVAGTLLARPDWVERGRRAVDFLVTNLRAGEAGMYHVWDDSGPRTLGILDDQAQMLLVLLECYEVTGHELYFEQARRMSRTMERDWHEPSAGFTDLAAGYGETELLTEPAFPMQVNVDMAEAFLWLGRLTHDERHLQLAQETLGVFARGLEARGLAVAGYARVVDRLLSAEPEFKIVAEFPAGEPDSVADPLHRAALRLPLAGRTVQRLDRVADIDLMRQLGLPDVAKVAYVCMGNLCSPSLTAPDQLLPAIDDLVEQPFL